MEYGLRSYEALQRLMWFLFFLVCLVVAYPLSSPYPTGASDLSNSARPLTPEALKSARLWIDFQWFHLQPFGKFMTYLVWVALVFLAGKLLWLGVQFTGKMLVRNLLARHVVQPARHPAHVRGSVQAGPAESFPVEALLAGVDSLPLQILFHPFQRLRLMLSKRSGSTFSAEELIEKERRIVEMDWQILYGSWSPYRWLLWLLPILGLIQTSWLLYQGVQPALAGHKEIQDVFGSVLRSFIPLGQIIAVTVLLRLGLGLLRRIEDLYLSHVDALLYDRFLSRLPFHSSDTLILLEAMKTQFQELHSALRRLERSMVQGKEDTSREQI